MCERRSTYRIHTNNIALYYTNATRCNSLLLSSLLLAARSWIAPGRYERMTLVSGPGGRRETSRPITSLTPPPALRDPRVRFFCTVFDVSRNYGQSCARVAVANAEIAAETNLDNPFIYLIVDSRVSRKKKAGKKRVRTA